mmetsp:Transcript_26596/g.71361  ORF Transcript_26596/g.71361 Transcript_26596/m.71361 type:complete len:277 (-) Transcript_26596:2022-2852(-)
MTRMACRCTLTVRWAGSMSCSTTRMACPYMSPGLGPTRGCRGMATKTKSTLRRLPTLLRTVLSAGRAVARRDSAPSFVSPVAAFTVISASSRTLRARLQGRRGTRLSSATRSRTPGAAPSVPDATTPTRGLSYARVVRWALMEQGRLASPSAPRWASPRTRAPRPTKSASQAPASVAGVRGTVAAAAVAAGARAAPHPPRTAKVASPPAVDGGEGGLVAPRATGAARPTTEPTDCATRGTSGSTRSTMARGATASDGGRRRRCSTRRPPNSSFWRG